MIMRKIVWLIIVIGITWIHAWELLLMYLMAIIIPLVLLGFVFWLFNVDISESSVRNSNDSWEDGFISGLIMGYFSRH